MFVPFAKLILDWVQILNQLYFGLLLCSNPLSNLLCELVSVRTVNLHWLVCVHGIIWLRVEIIVLAQAKVIRVLPKGLSAHYTLFKTGKTECFRGKFTHEKLQIKEVLKLAHIPQIVKTENVCVPVSLLEIEVPMVESQLSFRFFVVEHLERRSRFPEKTDLVVVCKNYFVFDYFPGWITQIVLVRIC